jgi:hypothetical protein
MRSEKNENGKRIWKETFLNSFRTLDIPSRYKELLGGLEESGFRSSGIHSISAINEMTDMILGCVVVRVYLVDLSKESVICYRVFFWIQKTILISTRTRYSS